MDKTYTTVNGPLTDTSTPPIDWAEINYDASYKSDKGKWYCNDKWTDYTKPVSKALFNVSTPLW